MSRSKWTKFQFFKMELYRKLIYSDILNVVMKHINQGYFFKWLAFLFLQSWFLWRDFSWTTQTQIHNENWKRSHKAKYGTFPHAPVKYLTHTHTHTHAQIHTRFPKPLTPSLGWGIWKTSALPCQSGQLGEQQTAVFVVFPRHPAHWPIPSTFL